MTSNIYKEIDVIREAAQLLAKRFSMIADALLEATDRFWSVIHEDRISEWSDETRTEITNLATELSGDGDTHAHVEQLDSFQADSVIARILDLHKAMESLCSQEQV